ncbi:PEP-CTERM -sorting domain protein [Lyngbya aestuarii BL J]|uniref:PEP-CTERM-sorting domain protein n=1 Tax=Lyngbya aestuarii BL J TaxID=1348334 RepID=U7QIL3_9CYAN|nr:PEP-CTERM sorting domain-containing protein [Lyngbya aestuarii]ERT06895.1 PEP-CTERM -sorting domain protein [Lyngbya aestuarii BL J]
MKNLFAGVITSSVVAASVLSLSALDANAATMAQTSDVTAGDGINATAVDGANAGNDTGNSDFIDRLNGGLFGNYTWELADKSDEASSIPDVTLNMTGQGETSGSWSITGLDNSSPFVISLKASNSYSAYFFDAGSALEGMWNTIGTSTNKKGKAQAISHISVFVASNQFTDTPDSQEVPEPGTLFGLLTLGGMVFGKKAMSRNS